MKDQTDLTGPDSVGAAERYGSRMDSARQITGIPAVHPGPDGTYVGELAEGWDINGVPNGGYSGMFGVLAMLDASKREDPLTITGHYLRPTAPGPVEIAVETIKTGRLITTMSAIVTQQGKQVLRFTGSFGELSALTGPDMQTLRPPTMPGPDGCVSRGPVEGQDFPPRFHQQVNGRVAPEHVSDYRRPRDTDIDPNTPAVINGWIRHYHEPTTLPDLYLFADAFAPPIFQTGYGPSWVPTVELTVHFRRRPVSDWIAAHLTAASIAGGLQTEDGTFWDADGNLVAQSRQLALAPTVQ